MAGCLPLPLLLSAAILPAAALLCYLFRQYTIFVPVALLRLRLDCCWCWCWYVCVYGVHLTNKQTNIVVSFLNSSGFSFLYSAFCYAFSFIVDRYIKTTDFTANKQMITCWLQLGKAGRRKSRCCKSARAQDDFG